MSTLWAISDLHVDRPRNRAAVEALAPRPDDDLLIAGDVADRDHDIAWALDALCARFRRVSWVPGNHELWTRPPATARGVARYQELVSLCRARGVATPEDPWNTFDHPDGDVVIALCHLGYDYTFGPEGLDRNQVVAWAADQRIRPRDEAWLHPDPHPDLPSWCHAQVAAAEARRASLPPEQGVVLVNHYCLRAELVRIYKIPRYAPWCGTRLTEDWHRRFPIRVAVSGHLHMRATDWIDGVRFEEVSLGYPRHWREEAGLGTYLRQIWPPPEAPPALGTRGPLWTW